MRCLITGGAGFVGSHLCDELLAAGDEVHVLDDLSTGSIDNISHLKDQPNFAYTIDSAGNPPLVAELVDWSDCVYHLAAAVGVELVVESPVRAIETNVHCTEVVLAQASKKRKPTFIASTSEVYGRSKEIPFREDGDLVMGPTVKGRWAYACSKAIDEFLAIAYWRERGLPTVVARLFNTVGPRQTGRYGMVIPRLIGQALGGAPLTVYGDGSQQRCFCHVSEVARALSALMRDESVYGEVFNIGSNEETTILNLAERVRELTGSDSEIVFVPYDEAYRSGFEDMPRRIPALEKINRFIGWEPTTSLDQILTDVIEHDGERLARDHGGAPGPASGRLATSH